MSFWFTPFDDWRENLLLMVLAVVVLSLLFPQGPGTIRFLLSDPADFFSPPSDTENLKFDEDEVSLLNEVSSRSLMGGVAAERLYCFDLNNENGVEQLRLADVILDSSRGSVTGKCLTRFPGESVKGTVHTQPDGISQLSQEDKDVEGNGLEYSCIQYDTITEGVGGRLGGINCWEIVYDGRGEPVFNEVEVVSGG